MHLADGNLLVALTVVDHVHHDDAYLVGLAEHHGGRLATFDRGLRALHGDRVVLLDG